jgi:hypothetical protein
LSAARISGGTLGGSFTVPDGQPIILNATGTNSVLQFNYSGTQKGSLYATTGNITMLSTSGAYFSIDTGGAAWMSNSGTTTFIAVSSNIALYGAVSVNLPDAAGANSFQVKDSGSQVQFSISSNGAFVYPDADATALGAYAGRMPWYIAGNLRYVPYYNA